MDPVYLAAAIVGSLIHPLPAGTAYFLGVVLITMMTGRLMQGKGSLARAVFPFVVHLRWGWHRAERARERGKLWVDALLDGAGEGCLSHLAVEPVRLGPQQREVTAVDSSTIARLRAVRANLVAVGHPGRAHQRRAGLGLVQRVRCGASCQEAVAHVFTDLPPTPRKRLIAVDAGIATKEQFAAATNQDALVGRLRRNCTLRCAPPPPTGKRGRRPRHGAVLHPGAAHPEVEPAEDFTRPGENGAVRVRRWTTLHFEEYPPPVLAVVRIDDPTYKRPLLIGTTATELTTEECEQAYGHRWPGETNFFVAPRTRRPWRCPGRGRRRRWHGVSGWPCWSGGAVLKALAAGCEPLALGPWDHKPERSAGRLANHLDIHATQFAALALQGAQPKNYRKIPKRTHVRDLWDKIAA